MASLTQGSGFSEKRPDAPKNRIGGEMPKGNVGVKQKGGFSEQGRGGSPNQGDSNRSHGGGPPKVGPAAGGGGRINLHKQRLRERAAGRAAPGRQVPGGRVAPRPSSPSPGPAGPRPGPSEPRKPAPGYRVGTGAGGAAGSGQSPTRKLMPPKIGNVPGGLRGLGIRGDNGPGIRRDR